MKKILFVKLTSLGDLIHALPALTDAKHAYPGVQFDWVIDENFREVANWHGAVGEVFTTNHRQWRKNLFRSLLPMKRLIQNIRKTNYDLILDGQGNFKSALIVKSAKGPRAGFNRESVRETIASFAYEKKYSASWTLHAIDRLRALFAAALHYPLPKEAPDFGLLQERFRAPPFTLPSSFFVFIPNATWETKLWPEPHWIELMGKVHLPVLLPWGSDSERARVERLGKGAPNAIVLPKLNLSEMGFILARAKGCVSLDTGFSHLAAALKIPTVTLYGPTDSTLIGTLGGIRLQAKRFCAPCDQKKCPYQRSLSNPPCMIEMSPELVFEDLKGFLLR